MSGPSITRANSRYRRAFALVMILYVVMCFVGPLYLGKVDTSPKWLSALIAILTALPIIGVFLLKWRYIKETDEYTRARMVEAMLIAAGLTLSFCAVWGFLELFQLVPHFWTFLTVPVFFFSLGLTSFVRFVSEKVFAS